MTPPPAVPPLAVYVHWPYCARICPYCDFNVVRDRRQAGQAALVRAIVSDLEGHAALTGERMLGSIFFGGGTPSLMAPEWAAQVIEAAQRLWRPTAGIEITLEANPTDAEAARFAAFAAGGVNRLSLGVQALDDDALAVLGRNHDAAEARRAARLAAKAFPRLSIDLIYARPGQAPAAWREELAGALTLGAEHISPYQLTIEPGTAFERARMRGELVPPEETAAAALFEATQETLSQAGFEAYEVSNHARGETARSRHNLAYWRGWDYVGVGPGAHGRLSLGGTRTASLAASRPSEYVAAVERTGRGWVETTPLSPREAAIERLLMGLRTTEGTPFDDLAALGLTREHPGLVPLVELGLLAADNRRVRATPRGRPVLDRLIAELIC